MTTCEVIYGHAVISDEMRRDVHLKLLLDADEMYRWYTEDGIEMGEEGATVGEAWNMLLHDSYNSHWQLRFLSDCE